MPAHVFKKLAEKLPYPVGSQLVRVPFSWRLGRAYSESARDLGAFEAGLLFTDGFESGDTGEWSTTAP